MLAGCAHIAQQSKLLAEEGKIIEFTQHLMQHRHAEQPIDEALFGGYLVKRMKVQNKEPSDHETVLVGQFIRVTSAIIADGNLQSVRQDFLASLVDALAVLQLAEQSATVLKSHIEQPSTIVLQQLQRAFLHDLSTCAASSSTHLLTRLKLNVTIVSTIKEWVAPHTKHMLNAEQRDLAASIVQAGCEMKAPSDVMLEEDARSACLELQ